MTGQFDSDAVTKLVVRLNGVSTTSLADASKSTTPLRELACEIVPVRPELKLAVNFKQVGAGDSAGPTLKSVSVLTPNVDSGATAQIVTLKVRVKDNSSGVAGFSMGFGRMKTGQQWPEWTNIQSYWSPMYTWDSNTQHQVLIEEGNCNADKTHAIDPTIQTGWSDGTACQISGNNKDGLYEVKFVVPAHAAAGNHRIYNFNATDKANNSGFTMYDDIVKRKLNVGFKNG